MASTAKSSRENIRAAERNFQERGFVKCGVNWYRVHGQDLLQMVTVKGLPARTTDAHFTSKETVAFAVYSMYADLPWVDIPIMNAKRDLIPNITAGEFAHKTHFPPFLGPDSDAVYMNEVVLPFLDEMNTHAQLADLLESADRWDGHHVRVNDSNKMIPYLLSGQPQKVLDTVNAIEQQNQQAYLSKCETAEGYDAIFHKQKMDKRLAPYIALRNDILSQNTTSILDSILSNYHNNKHRLEEMQIPVPAQHMCNDDLIKLFTATP